MNNFEKIKENLTAEKLARFINLENENICKFCIYNNCTYCNNECIEGIEQWLLKEAENEQIY